MNTACHHTSRWPDAGEEKVKLRSGKKITTAVILILLLATPTWRHPYAIQKGDYRSFKEEIDKYVIERMRKNDLKGISMALVDDQTLVFADGYGWADEGKKIPARPDTLYQIGAISKIFTAIAVMKLRDKGKIDLDAPLARYIPEFSIKSHFPNPKSMTVRTLLTQHTGLPSEFFRGMYTKQKAVPLNEYVKNALASLKEDYLSSPPDTVYTYCNLGYTLLGYLVQKITSQDFVAYTDREIFQPLGMHNSSFSNEENHVNLTRGYVAGKEMPLFKVNSLPALSVHSSALEMANFMLAVMGGGNFGKRAIVNQKTLKEMMTPQNLKAKFDIDFKIGLGWQLDGYDFINDERLQYDGVVAWHGGDTIANNATLMLLPAEKLGVVVLCNTAKGLRESGNIAIRCLNLALDVKSGKIIHDMKEPALPLVKLPPEQMKSLEGNYSSEYIGFFSIKVEEYQWVMKVMDHDIKLLSHADASFSLRYYMLGFIPVNLEIFKNVRMKIDKVHDKTAVILLRNDKKYFGGMKIDRPEISPLWKSRMGEYEIIAPEDEIRLLKNPKIIMMDGFLIFKAELVYVKNISIMLPLEPFTDDECVIMGLGRNMGQTIKFSRVNGITVLTYSGLVLKKQR
jgi:CubicO group peptidase (beta-lactamase class C family)